MKKNIRNKLFSILLCVAITLMYMPMITFGADSDSSIAASVTYGGTTESFTSLDEAVMYFNSHGGTLRLEKDIEETLSDYQHLIELQSAGIFDLNGHKITAEGSGSSVIRVTSTVGNIEITDSSAAQTGAVSGSSYSVWHDGQRDVTITSGTYVNVGRMYTGSLIINGGTFTYPYPLYDSSDTGGSLSLSGGTFENGIIILTPTPTTTSIYNVLAADCTYEINEEVWTRSKVSALGDVRKIGDGKPVKVVKENSAVAGYTYYEYASDPTPDVYYFTSLSAAYEKAKSIGSDSNDYITLLKDSEENMTIDYDICMVFQGKATGVFTFEDAAIYLNEELPDGMKLRAKQSSYAEKTSYDTDILYVPNEKPDVNISADDVEPVDAGVKVYAVGTKRIGLIHEHSWIYELVKESNRQTIQALCQYQQSCTGPENYVYASVSIADIAFPYDGDAHKCGLSTSWSVGYPEMLLNADDICYYDSKGTPLAGEPTEVGVYTAEIAFGSQVATATLEILSLTPKAEHFLFTPPALTVYDGNSKAAEIAVDPSVTGMGELTVSYYDESGNLLDGPPADAGTYSVKVSVEEGSIYTASKDISDESWNFTVDPKPITAAITLSQSEFTANGAAWEPDVTAKDGDVVIPDSEYEVIYSDNIQPGTAKVTLTDKEGGNYIVSGSTTFNIKAAAPPETPDKPDAPDTPDTPITPDEPVTSEKSPQPQQENTPVSDDTKNADRHPETGDDTGLWLWIGLLAVCSIGVSVLAPVRRRNHK